MGTLIMISGANGSGKSRYAERIVARTTGERYYIATMRPCSEENLQRIEKHREQRKDLQFTTLECPYQVGAAEVERDGVVLLEDVSNLLANAMFERGGDEASVYADIEALCSRCRLLVAVTITGLCADGYDGDLPGGLHPRAERPESKTVRPRRGGGRNERRRAVCRKGRPR